MMMLDEGERIVRGGETGPQKGQWLRLKIPANMQVAHVIFQSNDTKDTQPGGGRGARSIKLLDRRRMSLSHFLKRCCP